MNDIKTLDIKPNSIVVIKVKPWNTKNIDTAIQEISIALEEANINKNIIVMPVQDLSDIEVIDEQQMNKLGWVRKPVTNNLKINLGGLGVKH